MRTRAVLAVTAVTAALALTGCSADSKPLPGPPPAPTPSASGSAAPVDTSCNPRASLRPTGALPAPGQMPAGSWMAKIKERGRLVLGTSQDTLLFSSRNPFTGRIEGFDVDLGEQIAQAIFGVPGKLQIKVIAYADRLPDIENGTVDLVADTMTVNCARLERVAFSTIYYDAGQKVLVSKTSPVKGIEDLGGKKVCAAVGSTSLDNIAAAVPRPDPVGMPAFGDCLVAFQQNQVDAISTDDTILAGMAAQDPYAKVVGKAFTKEPYGIGISKDHPEFTRFVNQVLARNQANGTWAATYRKWLTGPVPAPPVAEYK
jgi:polar amino acid transport system substrate-binding protein